MDSSANPTNLAIQTRDLRKVFGDKVAVRGLTLEVPRGEVFGFLGPNGAGKSTSIKMLLGLVAPSAGEASVLGASANGESVTRVTTGNLRPRQIQWSRRVSSILYFRDGSGQIHIARIPSGTISPPSSSTVLSSSGTTLDAVIPFPGIEHVAGRQLPQDVNVVPVLDDHLVRVGIENAGAQLANVPCQIR